MTYIEDLSLYSYANSAFYRPVTKAVGWLGRQHAFEVSPPMEEVLDTVWQYCKSPVAQMRGQHECEFCRSQLLPPSDMTSMLDALKDQDNRVWRAERNGETLFLGSAEIRVFGRNELIYAAPTLIYHYISVHHYNPPEEFLRALKESPKPPDPVYVERLKKLNLL